MTALDSASFLVEDLKTDMAIISKHDDDPTTFPRPFFVVLTKVGYFNDVLEYVYKV